MSIYTECQYQLQNEKIVTSSWSSNTFRPLLAISTSSPRIIFYTEDAQLQPDLTIMRGKIANCLRWNPKGLSLAIGWEDGAITMWSESDKLTREDKMMHKVAVIVITFNSDGSRMVTGDSSGNIGVWKTNKGLGAICQYSKESAILHAVFGRLATTQDEDSEKYSNIFFVATASGSMWLADDVRHCTEVCKVGGYVLSLLVNEKDNSLILITSNLLLVQFKVTLNDKINPSRKLKLGIAGDPSQAQTIWAGQGLLCTCSSENIIRFLNVDTDDNYVLTLAEPAFEGKLLSDKLIRIDYNPKKKILAGCTKDGYIVMWKARTAYAPSKSEEWEAKSPIKVNVANLTNISWSPGIGLLTAHNQSNGYILSEIILQAKIRDEVNIIQNSSKGLEITFKGSVIANKPDTVLILNMGIILKGLDFSQGKVLVWNGKEAKVYKVETTNQPVDEGVFETKSSMLGILEDTIVQYKEGKLELMNFKGVIKQSFNVTDPEEEVTNLFVSNKLMVISTSNEILKCWSVGRKQWKQLGVMRSFEKGNEKLGHMTSLAVNNDGTKIAILSESLSKLPSNKLYIYDIDIDNFQEYDYGSNKVPIRVVWDQVDSRMIAVEVEPLYNANSENPQKETKYISTLIISAEKGIKENSVKPLEAGEESLYGFDIPYYYVLAYTLDSNKRQTLTSKKKIMREFEGLEQIDNVTRDAIVNFSIHLAYENLDEAYNSVKNINNAKVWESMTQMCIKTKRLDVAQICLGNMKFARGAEALRKIMDEEEDLDVRLAIVAIQLNLIPEATELLKASKKYDILCNLLVSIGKYDEALAIAQEHYKIFTKSIYYKMAYKAELNCDYARAADYYEKSGTHHTEVPRMYYYTNQLDKLLEYIETKKETQLFLWWAQLLESRGKCQEAVKFYEQAGNNAALVRIACKNDDIDYATKLAVQSNNPASYFSLAKKLEGEKRYKEAIQFYAKAQKMAYAIKLAKETGNDVDIKSMALQSSKQVMIQTAIYFEGKELYENAATLYDRGGNPRKALRLCQQYKLFDLMKVISKNIDESKDPETLANSAQYFLDNGQIDKAIHVLIMAKQYIKAVELLEKGNVPVTEDMIIKLTPEANNEAEMKEKDLILGRIAKVCKKQGNFGLACTKYTQAGHREKAMKCLLKQGNIKEIINFAVTARTPAVYILAANYLQNSDWHSDVNIMKNIISFYTKAKAYEQLSNFYDACAQVEIDEYKEYEKALGAMKEALKCLSKITTEDRDDKIKALEYRLGILDNFVNAMKIIETNPTEMLKICSYLLSLPDAEKTIRMGDVFAQVIEYHCKAHNYKDAFEMLKTMNDRKIPLNPFLDQETIAQIYRNNGIEYEKQAQPPKAGDDIGEDIHEDAS